MALTRVQLPATAVAEAWDAYRDACHRVAKHDYEEREPFAWRRLQKRLREIRDYEEYQCR